ncbi:hypothetical protein LWI29_024149 [Acer saccharum]|uniref:PGG domain-containing protein n=1 Tax=Acer saccharum TaxID=4024 RepID=A0AA39TV58_ACESA|nr:hypothetical protein LWI29_024149 [Acer saccharum]
MEKKLYNAAVEGDMNLIATPNKNTIMHVNIGFNDRPSSRFVEQVLETCPTLLLQVNDNGDTPLHVAAKQGCVAIVEVLIKQARTQRDQNLESGVTLHEAGQNHFVGVVKILTREDTDFPYSANNCGETPLYMAASTGSLGAVVEILETCTSATYQRPCGITALHGAVKRNHLDQGDPATMDSTPFDIIIVPDHHQLLDDAADGKIEPFKQIAEQIKFIVTPIKNTVLHINIASEKVSTQFVEEILGICPSLLVQVNAQGDTPLHVAVKFKRIDVVTALIKKAKDIQRPEELESGIGAVRQMLRMTNNKGNTALHEAMRNKSGVMVRVLFKEDPDFSYSANHCGETPLYIAAEKGFSEGVNETCTSMSYNGPNGKTALHAAVRINNQVVTRKICENNNSLTKQMDDNGWTPLHCAAYYGTFEAMQVLLEFDKSPAYVRDKYRKMTPLHLAAGRGHTNIIKEIILRCPDCYELVDDKGWSVLHFAMTAFNLRMLRILFENPLIKKLIHEKDVKGNTPFHVLAIVTPYYFSYISLRFINKVEGDITAVNNNNVSVRNVLMLGCPELQQEILKLEESVGPYQYGVVRVNKVIGTNEEFQKEIEKAKESHLIVAALIATVTFTAAFTLPGGVIQDGDKEGTAILSKKAAFQAFVITDAIALVFSLSSVIAYFLMSLPAGARSVKASKFLLVIGYYYTVMAMGAMVIAFVTGTYAVLTTSLWLAILTTFIGLSFFLLMYLIFEGMLLANRQ